MIGDLGFAGEIVTTDRVWFGFDMINSLLQHTMYYQRVRDALHGHSLVSLYVVD